MNTYIARHADDKLNWTEANTLSVESIHWEPDNGCRMQAQVLWSDEGLHVHLFTTEKDIRAENHSPYDMICEDSCMEFFFRPDEDDDRYFNFETNLNGWFYLGIGHDRFDSVRLFPDNQKELLDVQPRKTEDGWETYYTIPLSFLRIFFPGLTFESGKKIYCNFFKCGDFTVHPHYMSWNPMSTEEPDFHRTCDFGLMTLE